MLGADGPLYPRGATIPGVADETAVTGDPALFRIDEINGVQVLAAGADVLAAPSALRIGGNRCKQDHSREHDTSLPSVRHG